VRCSCNNIPCLSSTFVIIIALIVRVTARNPAGSTHRNSSCTHHHKLSMALAPAFAELSQLRQSLSRLNYAGEVSDMVLFPGQQRWTLIRWLMKG
jgi:hypothetical protein